MVVDTLEKRWEILRHYFECHGDILEEKHRQLRMFVILWKKLKELRIIDKPKTVCTPENIAAVKESVHEAPSTHRRSYQLNNSEPPLRRILHKDLGMTLYKVQLVQELKQIYHPMRFRFDKWACGRLTEDAEFGTKIIFSDEAYFDLCGYINK